MAIRNPASVGKTSVARLKPDVVEGAVQSSVGEPVRKRLVIDGKANHPFWTRKFAHETRELPQHPGERIPRTKADDTG